MFIIIMSSTLKYVRLVIFVSGRHCSFYSLVRAFLLLVPSFSKIKNTCSLKCLRFYNYIVVCNSKLYKVICYNLFLLKLIYTYTPVYILDSVREESVIEKDIFS